MVLKGLSLLLLGSSLSLAAATCSESVPQGATLFSVAESHGIPWQLLRLLNSDVWIPSYDADLFASGVPELRYAHEFVVEGGPVSAQTIADSFGMNAELLADLNPGMQSSTEVADGSVVCVIPTSDYAVCAQ